VKSFEEKKGIKIKMEKTQRRRSWAMKLDSNESKYIISNTIVHGNLINRPGFLILWFHEHLLLKSKDVD
jgi:hypothetical protein